MFPTWTYTLILSISYVRVRLCCFRRPTSPPHRCCYACCPSRSAAWVRFCARERGILCIHPRRRCRENFNTRLTRSLLRRPRSGERMHASAGSRARLARVGCRAGHAVPAAPAGLCGHSSTRLRPLRREHVRWTCIGDGSSLACAQLRPVRWCVCVCAVVVAALVGDLAAVCSARTEQCVLRRGLAAAERPEEGGR